MRLPSQAAPQSVPSKGYQEMCGVHGHGESEHEVSFNSPFRALFSDAHHSSGFTEAAERLLKAIHSHDAKAQAGRREHKRDTHAQVSISFFCHTYCVPRCILLVYQFFEEKSDMRYKIR